MQVIKSEDTPKGKSLQVKIKEKTLSIIFTWHALDAIKEYRFSIEEVLNFLLNPEEVIKGHGGRLIAHRRLNSHLARVVYEYDRKSIVVVTFYKAHVQRYYRGGSYEDKILSRR
jgi:mRNA-degrading endonuclease RelE of RelBE toxin-antitoxin system